MNDFCRRMARMDGNGLQLQEISQFFQVPRVYFGEIAKNRL